MKRQFFSVLVVALFALVASGNLLLAQMITVEVPLSSRSETGPCRPGATSSVRARTTRALR